MSTKKRENRTFIIPIGVGHWPLEIVINTEIAVQTPSHVAISLFLWRKVPDWKQTVCVVFGAVLPDLNMFLFYAYQKIIGSSESDIWGTLYFEEHWQLFFDCFNAIPIYLAVVGIAYWRGNRLLLLVASSALVHVLCDLPLHNDDAHRHFLPFSQWRFVSPVSYWDPKHFGLVAAGVEFVSAFAICCYVGFGNFASSIRVAARIDLFLYVLAGVLIAGYLLMR